MKKIDKFKTFVLLMFFAMVFYTAVQWVYVEQQPLLVGVIGSGGIAKEYKGSGEEFFKTKAGNYKIAHLTKIFKTTRCKADTDKFKNLDSACWEETPDSNYERIDILLGEFGRKEQRNITSKISENENIAFGYQAWSPDGKALAFAGMKYEKTTEKGAGYVYKISFDVYTCDENGDNVTRIYTYQAKGDNFHLNDGIKIRWSKDCLKLLVGDEVIPISGVPVASKFDGNYSNFDIIQKSASGKFYSPDKQYELEKEYRVVLDQVPINLSSKTYANIYLRNISSEIAKPQKAKIFKNTAFNYNIWTPDGKHLVFSDGLTMKTLVLNLSTLEYVFIEAANPEIQGGR